MIGVILVIQNVKTKQVLHYCILCCSFSQNHENYCIQNDRSDSGRPKCQNQTNATLLYTSLFVLSESYEVNFSEILSNLNQGSMGNILCCSGLLSMDVELAP